MNTVKLARDYPNHNAAIEYANKQHIGWLKLYIAEMNENNWRDMRLRCERQLDQLSKLRRKEGRDET